MEIAVVCGMSNDKVRARLLPLVNIEEIERIHLIRRRPFEMQKVKSYSTPTIIRWSLVLAEIYRFFTLCYICLKIKPNLIYGVYFVPHGIFAAVAGLVFRLPVIQEIIGTDRLKITKSKILQKLLSTAKHIGVRGTTSLEQLSSLGIDKGRFFISNSVNALDFDLFKPEPIEKIYDLIYVGRMDENKQLKFIIDAAANLSQDFPNLRIALVGDGPERAELEKQSAHLGLKNKIFFVGKQNYKDIPRYLNQSRIFVMTSAFEGLPVAMIEAISCGLPVVVPDVGDIGDIADHGYNAWLYAENNFCALVEGIRSILEDPSYYQRLFEGAVETRDKFITEYSISNAKDLWKEILS